MCTILETRVNGSIWQYPGSENPQSIVQNRGIWHDARKTISNPGLVDDKAPIPHTKVDIYGSHMRHISLIW